MAESFDGLARMIVQNVGGRDNVAGLNISGRCLVFDLKDDGRANTAVMESIGGITGVRKEGGKYLVEVEGPVNEVYAAVCEKGKIEGQAGIGGASSGRPSSERGTVLRYVVGTIVAFVVAWFVLPMLDADATVAARLGVGAAASIVAAFIASKLINEPKQGSGARPVPQPDTSPAKPSISSQVIGAPVRGKVVALSEVPDEAFASGVLGKGLGIQPAEGKLYAPCDGEISTFFPTGHAIGILSSGGAEVLMHVGLDTVSLNGEGFTPEKKQGDRCKQGELLLTFDIGKIEAAGLNAITPVIITNTDDFAEILPTDKAEVAPGEEILTLRA